LANGFSFSLTSTINCYVRAVQVHLVLPVIDTILFYFFVCSKSKYF